MDTCPIEVLLYIFELACDDDGSTGRALSLVSRRVQNLSKDHKYQSVALLGLQRIAPFAATLKQLPKGTRVRHLFFSTMAQNTPGGLRPLSDEMQDYRGICDALLNVMQMVAPTLRTCRIVSHLTRMVTLIPVSCPNLVELTLDGPFPTLPYVYHAPYFPSLRSLTFSNFIDYPSYLFDDISTQAPNLKTLSFYLAQACRNFPVDLASALGTPTSPRTSLSDSPTPETSTSNLPTSLKYVFVQPGSAIDLESRSAYCMRSVQELMDRKLRYMQKHDKQRRVKYLSPRPQDLPQDALGLWLQRL